MRKQPGIAGSSTETLAVLSVSPLEEDHRSLDSIIGHSNWMLFKARDLASALALLQQHEIAVVLLERDLLPGRWIEMLEQIKSLRNAPSLIVASRLADDRLWAEALNLGAWDVLAKPFDRSEVFRSVKSAWQHWHDQIQMPALAMKVMKWGTDSGEVGQRRSEATLVMPSVVCQKSVNAVVAVVAEVDSSGRADAAGCVSVRFRWLRLVRSWRQAVHCVNGSARVQGGLDCGGSIDSQEHRDGNHPRRPEGAKELTLCRNTKRSFQAGAGTPDRSGGQASGGSAWADRQRSILSSARVALS